jgi:type VI secretion system secreted protein VgrG
MFAHTDRPLTLTTPLGKDKLVLTAFRGREAISELFRFELDTIWEDTKKLPAFEDLLGKVATVEFTIDIGNDTRYFSGIVSRVMQGEQDFDFTHYRLEVVPTAWLLTRRAQCRIFQHLTIPEILKKVFTGIDVVYDIDNTPWEPREYVVQFRETDFDFASRLMEEEGIFYFFKHTGKGHTMVLANQPSSYPSIPFSAKVVFEELRGEVRETNRVTSWSKTQEIRPGKYTLHDRNFSVPNTHLEADKPIQDSVQIGRTTHKLTAGGAASLEIYDYPGGYANRFDEIDKGGGAQPDKVQKIFEDNKRTVEIRMQQGAVLGMAIEGRSDLTALTAGHGFELTKHFSDDGKYVLVSVEHDAYQPIGADEKPFTYENRFSAIPIGLPFRPQRKTPVPRVHGVQSAVVVGPSGDPDKEQIFTDKYGRVKVQFDWDREGKKDSDSSCWIRVCTFWAGKHWGGIHIPRIGQEVMVEFVDGDIDRPIVVGSVYNAFTMPPWELPGNKTQSGILSRSSENGTAANANAIRFEDKKGSEQVWIHAEKNQDIEVENDETHWVGHDRTKTIDHDETVHVKHDRTETVDNNETITVHANRTETVDKDETITIHQNRTKTVDKNDSLTVGVDQSISIGKDTTSTVGKTDSITAGKSIVLTVGANSITIDQQGITLSGIQIVIDAKAQFKASSAITQMSSSGPTKIQGAVILLN